MASSLPLHSRRSAHSGFTLIEILIVIGIIGTLLVLSSSGLQAIRQTAQETRCTNNLRQIGAAILAYAGDHNGGILPRNLGYYREREDKADLAPERTWHARLILLGYLEISDVFYCPSFTPRNLKEARNPLNIGTAGGETYGMRMWTAPGSGWAKEREEHKPLASIREPANFFLLADSVWTNPKWKSQGYGLVPDSPEQFVHLRHREKANTLFADGHVAAKGADYFADLGRPSEQGGQRDYTGGRERVYRTTTQMEF